MTCGLDPFGASVRVPDGLVPEILDVGHDLLLFANPGQNVLRQIAEVTTDPVARRTCAAVPPLVEGRDGDAEKVRDVFRRPEAAHRRSPDVMASPGPA
ncbi:hypothetical protein Hesp01_34870 [Herbidospora sp. NBRC 101105]|nr:hypothetical protein Hesp01_34870 [Herbidospora sp. NBRC 101105]